MKKTFLASAAILFLMSVTVSCKPKAHCQAYGKVDKVVSKTTKPA